MTTPLPPIARLDVPLAVLEADMQRLLKARAAAAFHAGELAEQRHALLDLDADSVCPLAGAAPYPYLNAGGLS